jgi:hypothetical protein
MPPDFLGHKRSPRISPSPPTGERAGVRGVKFFQPLTLSPFQGRGDFIVYPECYLQGRDCAPEPWFHFPVEATLLSRRPVGVAKTLPDTIALTPL